MQIKIEVDVKPEELRRFLGLPDVAGLQEDVIKFVRGAMATAAAAGDNFDPASFVKDNLDNFLKHPKVQRLLFGAATEAAEPARKRRRAEETPEEPSTPE